jgi:SAM-dependent methyltransferase
MNMSDVQTMFRSALKVGNFIEASFSHVRKKSLQTYNKLHVRPVDIKGEYLIQLAYYYDKKVLHENLPYREAADVLSRIMGGYFKQGEVHTMEADFQLLANKKGEVVVKEKKATKELVGLDHDKKKQYVLTEGTPYDFLVALGIMSPEGQVFKKRYAKFRQINRYLEILEDAISSTQFEDVVRVVDFGCGKAYLTFAMYYYFVQKLSLKVEIVGLDLKADVIAHLTELKEQLGYEGLVFYQGDIKDYQATFKPDIVVSLHACDTATDEALAKAVLWGAKVIMAVPCCQHEAFTQIKQPNQQIYLKHGILKERFAALATDAIRANMLELLGYETVVMEFVDMEHTPKNLMIRGVKTEGVKKPSKDELIQFLKYWSLKPHLVTLLKDFTED